MSAGHSCVPSALGVPAGVGAVWRWAWEEQVRATPLPPRPMGDVRVAHTHNGVWMGVPRSSLSTLKKLTSE